jgi:hypothetical protein
MKVRDKWTEEESDLDIPSRVSNNAVSYGDGLVEGLDKRVGRLDQIVAMLLERSSLSGEDILVAIGENHKYVSVDR